jgi:hypothetical protein
VFDVGKDVGENPELHAAHETLAKQWPHCTLVQTKHLVTMERCELGCMREGEREREKERERERGVEDN